MKIAFIGLGNMGSGMALNLVQANHEVNIYDINKDVIDDNLLNQILADNNPQRISEVMATIDQSLAMQKKGMSSQTIMDTLFESWSRKKQAEGGLIPGYATGGVSNLFRSR